MLTHGLRRASGAPSSSTTAPSEVDASLLLHPQVGFLPPDDPRVLGHHRRRRGGPDARRACCCATAPSSGVDGLAGDEHPFLACSFWLVSAYAGAGRDDEAHALMERLGRRCPTTSGLMAEEYDPVRERMVGNFPQAFTHLALIGAAVTLGS